MDNPEIQATLAHKTEDEDKKNIKQKLKAIHILFTKYIYIEINLNTAVSHKLLTCQLYHYLFLIDHIIDMAFAPI